VPEGSKVCELYGGVGLIGVNVLKKALWVRTSDSNPDLIPVVKKTFEALPVVSSPSHYYYYYYYYYSYYYYYYYLLLLLLLQLLLLLLQPLPPPP